MLETAKLKKNSSQTTKKFAQNPKPHTKLYNKTDAMVTSGAYIASYTLTLILSIICECHGLF